MKYACVFSGIRQLQLVLLKVSLLLGVEVNTGVEFQGLIEPTAENGAYAHKHLFSTFSQYIRWIDKHFLFYVPKL